MDELPRLYAAGAPDEAELVNWLRAKGNAEVKSIDVALHRRQVGFTPDEGEQQRFDLASMMVNAHRATHPDLSRDAFRRPKRPR